MEFAAAQVLTISWQLWEMLYANNKRTLLRGMFSQQYRDKHTLVKKCDASVVI
jgi:hypothetical protein